MIRKIILTAAVIALVASTLQAQDDKKPDKFEWVPSAAHTADMTSAFKAGDVGLPVVFTKIPKATANVANYTEVYTIDLEKFGISNDGTNAEATSKGINAALQDAKKVGANRIVFPKGTYLISETDPIVLDHKDTIVDLNGATLQINSGNVNKTCIVQIAIGAENLRLTNGTLRGDKDTHQGRGSGIGLKVIGGHNLEIDHLVVANVSLSGVNTQKGMGTRDEYGYRGVSPKNVELGAFSEETGEPILDENRSRTIKPYDMDNFDGEFEFGYIFGYGGFPCIKDRNYQACFYDADMKFIEKKRYVQFKKYPIPEKAKFIHLEFNQPEVTATGEGVCGSLSNMRASMDVHFHNNILLGNKALGLSFCGGQRWIIENNHFERNGGRAPGFGVDFEDGWEMMQDVVFRNNTFKDNDKGDLVVCAGSEMIFDNNEFENIVHFWGRTHNYTFSNNKVTGSPAGFMTRSGVLSIHDNYYKDCTISARFDNTGDSGIPQKPGEQVATSPMTFRNETLVNVKSVTGSYFNFIGSNMKNTKFVVGKITRLVHFESCTVDDVAITYEKEGPEVYVGFDDCEGQIAEDGPGLQRRKLLK